MTVYECQRCGFRTERSNNFKQHLGRKVVCKPNCSDISVDEIYAVYFNDMDKKYSCMCGKKYTYQSGLCWHRRTCSQSNEDISQRLKSLEEELSRLKVQNAVSDSPHIINNTHNINQSINQNIHIHLTDFGKENLSYLPPDFYRECLMNGALGVIQMIEKVWFDEEHPENFNIRLSSLKNMLVQYYKHPEWEICGFHDAIDKMIHTSQNKIIVESKVNDLECNNSLISNLDSVQNLKPEVKRKIKDKCKGKLVNRRSQTALPDMSKHVQLIPPTSVTT